MGLSLGALADTGVLTYTYDIIGTSSDVWFTTPPTYYSYNQVSWTVVSSSSNDPYPLDGGGRGSGYRRNQDYPGNLMSQTAYATSASGKDAVWMTGAGYGNTFFPPTDSPPRALDHNVTMLTKGAGRYAGATGAQYTPVPREAHFHQTTDPQGNITWDYSSGTSAGSWLGYTSIPVSNGPPPKRRAYSLTRTYRISGTEYGTFTQQPGAPAPAYTRTYVTNFDRDDGPVSWVDMPFRINSITRVVSDLGLQPFPRDTTSTVVKFEGPEGSLTSRFTGYRNVAGLHNFTPQLASEPTLDFDTTGYSEFITVFTEGTGRFAGARGVILGWQQGLYEPSSVVPFTVTHWTGYLSIPAHP
jgi:hypothetical protein